MRALILPFFSFFFSGAHKPELHRKTNIKVIVKHVIESDSKMC